MKITAKQLAEAKRMMETAKKELGTKELPGPTANKRIVEFLETVSLPKGMETEDETPWCSAFVNWVAKASGLKGTGNAMARSWLKWGTPSPAPVIGAVVVLKRGAPPSGHVGLYAGRDGAEWLILGGNQGDQVSIRKFLPSQVLGVRIPGA